MKKTKQKKTKFQKQRRTDRSYKFLFLGAPGVGKGTFSKLIAKHYDAKIMTSGQCFFVATHTVVLSFFFVLCFGFTFFCVRLFFFNHILSPTESVSEKYFLIFFLFFFLYFLIAILRYPVLFVF